jgi:hypothetical protein
VIVHGGVASVTKSGHQTTGSVTNLKVVSWLVCSDSVGSVMLVPALRGAPSREKRAGCGIPGEHWLEGVTFFPFNT